MECDLSLPRTIELAESGGVAGISIRRRLDTGALAERERAEFATMWEGASEHLAGGGETASGRPDERQYEITAIEQDGSVRSTRVGESTAPEAVLTLCNWVQRRARPMPKQR